MLGRAVKIAPYLARQLEIATSVRRYVRERRVAPPVFGRGIGLIDFGHVACGTLQVEQPGRPTAGRIVCRVVRKGEEVPEGRGWLHGGLAVAHVELAPTPARDMDEKAVIGWTAILGRIQAQPKEGAH